MQCTRYAHGHSAIVIDMFVFVFYILTYTIQLYSHILVLPFWLKNYVRIYFSRKVPSFANVEWLGHWLPWEAQSLCSDGYGCGLGPASASRVAQLTCYPLSALSFLDWRVVSPRHPWTPTLRHVVIQLSSSVLLQLRRVAWNCDHLAVRLYKG